MSMPRERKAIRVELFSLTLNDEKKETGSDKGPFRVYINDGFRVHEIYNPGKVNEFFNPLPPEYLHQLSDEDDDDDDDEEDDDDDEEDDDDDDEDEDEEKKPRVLLDLGDPEHDTDLVLTGPNGDIVAWDYFDVIVHYETGNRDTDDSHLEKSRSLYLRGKRADKSDEIQSWIGHGIPRFLNSRYPAFRVQGPFGFLKLDFIAFEYSRLVTVDVKWFLKDSSIVRGGGEAGDAKLSNAAATESRSYICGELSFHSSLYHDATSILLSTPEDKGIEVEHGNSIRLLRSKFAIPLCNFFTVEASLKDPVTKSAVKGHLDFMFDQFSEEKNYLVSQELDGRGAKIVVDVTMLPNDMDYLEGSGCLAFPGLDFGSMLSQS